MTTTANGVSTTPRLGFEDTLRAILDANQQIVELLEAMRDTASAISGTTGAVGNASVEIEDLAKGVKVSTKGYVGIPLAADFIRQRIAEHALAHRLAQEAYDNQWRQDLAQSVARPRDTSKAGDGHALEELPDFGPAGPF